MKKRLIVIVAFLALILLGVGFYLYKLNSMNLGFSVEKLVVEYGEVVSLADVIGETTYDISYDEVDTSVLGEKTYDITVKDGIFQKVIEYPVSVVDTHEPVIELKYRVISTFSEVDFTENVISATDEVDGVVDVSVEGAFDGAGVYEIVYTATDSSGNQASQITYYLYQCTPSNIAEPFSIDGVIIANKQIPLPKDYNPKTSAEAEAKLDDMFADMASENMDIIARSGYRTYSYQKKLYDNYVALDGTTKADTYSARPGHSEHQLGTTFDIGVVDATFGNTEEYKWCLENAYKYGYILRYPKDKEEITGYTYEPWHWRYVGVELATEIQKSGLTLEEYFGIKSDSKYLYDYN